MTSYNTWHWLDIVAGILFSGFYLDIEEVAVPAKCLSPIIFITLNVVCENIMILLCGLAAAVMF